MTVVALEENYRNQHLSVTEAERPWVEGYTLKRQSMLVDLVREAGHSNAIALAVAAWVGEKALGKRDFTPPNSRSRYRRILEEVGPPPEGQTPRRLIRSGQAA